MYIKSPLFWYYFWNFRVLRFALSWFHFRGMVRNGIPRICLNFLLHGKEFRIVFSSVECSEWNFGSLLYFGSTERNSELCSLPQKGSEQIFYGSLLLFSFKGTEFRVVFSSAEGFGTEFREFLFRGTTGIPLEITNCSAYSVFRGIIFLSEIPNPRSRLPLDVSGQQEPALILEVSTMYTTGPELHLDGSTLRGLCLTSTCLNHRVLRVYSGF